MESLYRSLFFATLLTITLADYECLCNYHVETVVHPEPQIMNRADLGSLYEFDCKPTYQFVSVWHNWQAIQFENRVGYVELDEQTKVQTCPGQPSPIDIVTQPPTKKPTAFMSKPSVTSTFSSPLTSLTTTESPRTTVTTSSSTVRSTMQTSTVSTTLPTTKSTTETAPPSTVSSTTRTTVRSTTISTSTPTKFSAKSSAPTTMTTAPESTTTPTPTIRPTTTSSSIVTTTISTSTPSSATTTRSTSTNTTSTSKSIATKLPETSSTHPVTFKITTRATRLPSTIHSTTRATRLPSTIHSTTRATRLPSTMHSTTRATRLPSTMHSTTRATRLPSTIHSTTAIPTSTTDTSTPPTTATVKLTITTNRSTHPATFKQTTRPTLPTTSKTIASTTVTTKRPLQCPPQVPRSSNLKDFGNHCYEFILGIHKKWPDAEHDCNHRGGHLVSIGSSSEQNFIYHSLGELHFHGNKGIWIGFTDQDKEDDWRWSSGERITFRYWDQHQPGFFGSFKDCAMMDMRSLGHWIDHSCTGFLFASEKHGYVCEYEPRQANLCLRAFRHDKL